MLKAHMVTLHVPANQHRSNHASLACAQAYADAYHRNRAVRVQTECTSDGSTWEVAGFFYGRQIAERSVQNVWLTY